MYQHIQKYKPVFFIALLCTVLIYGKAHNAMLVDDGMSGIWEVKNNIGGGFLNSYGFHGYYYVTYTIINIFYRIFHLNDLPWFWLFAFMHALNTSFIYKLCKELSVWFRLNKMFAVVTTLLFLTGVYQSETIIWGATQHYVIGLAIFLYSCILLVQNTNYNKALAIKLLFLQALALVTIEMSFMFCFGYLALIFLLYGSKKQPINLRQFILNIFLPQLFLCFLFIVIYYLDRGAMVPHSGNDHFYNLVSTNAIKNYAIVNLKFYTYLQYISPAVKQFLLSLTDKLYLNIFIAIIPLLFIFLLQKTKRGIYLYALAVGYIFSVPYLNNFIATVFRYENDRYQYYAYVFYGMIVALWFERMNRNWSIALIAILISFNVYCNIDNANVRRQSGKLHEVYLKNYPFDNTKHTYIINVPVNLKGAYVLRDDFRLPIDYEVMFDKNIFKTQEQIVGYVAQTPYDEFAINTINDSTFNVHAKTEGVWYIYKAVGAYNYETPNYKFKLEQYGFTVSFKHKLADTERLLLFTNGKFQEIK